MRTTVITGARVGATTSVPRGAASQEFHVHPNQLQTPLAMGVLNQRGIFCMPLSKCSGATTDAERRPEYTLWVH